MADDSLITALSGFSGFAAGVRDVLVPHMQLKYQSQLSEASDERKRKTAYDDALSLEKEKIKLKPGKRFLAQNEATGARMPEFDTTLEPGQEGEIVKVKPPKVKPGFEDLTTAQQNLATKWNDDFRADSSSFVKKRDAYNNVLSSHKKEGEAPGGAGDLALIYAFTKLQDPTMVTEQEIRNAINTGRFGEKVKASLARVVEGDSLTPEIRADMVNTAKKIYGRSKLQQDKLHAEYVKQFEKMNIPADIFLRDYSAIELPEDEITQTKKDKIKALPPVRPGIQPPASTSTADDILREFNLIPAGQ